MVGKLPQKSADDHSDLELLVIHRRRAGTSETEDINQICQIFALQHPPPPNVSLNSAVTFPSQPAFWGRPYPG
jgi:hypothetical protein